MNQKFTGMICSQIKKMSDHFVKKSLSKLQNAEFSAFDLSYLVLVLKYGKGSLNSLQNAKNELAVMSSTIEWKSSMANCCFNSYVQNISALLIDVETTLFQR